MNEQMNTSGSNPGKGLGVAAMVVGIVAIVLAFITFGEILGGIAAILGVIGFILSNKVKAKNIMAIVGIVLGVAAVALSYYQEAQIEATFEEMGVDMENGFQEGLQQIVDDAEALEEAGH